MIYKVTPAHFGLTTRLQLLLGLGTLACFVLPMAIFPLIRPSWAWNTREVVAGLLTWLFLEFWWYGRHHYSLEVDDNGIGADARVVRKGRIRYLREIHRPPWRGGIQLILSERGSAWTRLLGGVIVIPNGLPEYEQLKGKSSHGPGTREAETPFERASLSCITPHSRHAPF